MNATMNNLTATATTSKKFAFTYNHITKKIVGTDVAFAKAGIPGSALEKELLARMEGQPTYTFEVNINYFYYYVSVCGLVWRTQKPKVSR